MTMDRLILDTERFTRGFAARLFQLNTRALQPRNHQNRLGFRRVVDVLEAELTELRLQKPLPGLYRDLVRLRNKLSPSNIGAFDSFESALRDLQLSVTDSPNPFYEEIVLTSSPANAEATLAEIPDEQRRLIDKAARAFLDSASSLP